MEQKQKQAHYLFSATRQPAVRDGRKKKTTKQLSKQILEAANGFVSENNEVGLVAFLQLQMHANPVAFMSLLSKLIPRQVRADVDHSGELRIRQMSEQAIRARIIELDNAE